MTTAEPLAVEQASLTTVAVQVKVITIGKRQMTLSVFRQLRKARAIDFSTLAWLGHLWGAVNYCPGGCYDGPIRYDYETHSPHLHVVWQPADGPELRRWSAFQALDDNAGLGHYLASLPKESRGSASARLKAAWPGLWDHLKSLDQLFIAV
jgi:hypothetical protein